MITIFLAIGAPFGVRYFLHPQAGEQYGLRVLKSITQGLSWPLFVWRILIPRIAGSSTVANDDDIVSNHEKSIHEKERGLLASIHALRELTTNAFGFDDRDLICATLVLRQQVETFVGLSLAANKAAADGYSNEYARDLFSIAGREGDDLLLATRCANRRNSTRITEHCKRARNLLIHSVADLHEALDRLLPRIVANESSERRLRLAAVELSKNTFDLLMLMKDEDAAMKIADLLNRQLSRLRRLEITSTRVELSKETGEVKCNARTSRLSQPPLSSESKFIQG